MWGGEAGLGVPLLKSEQVDEIISTGVGCDGGDAGHYGLYALITDVHEIDAALHVIGGVIVDNLQQTGDGPREEAAGLLGVNGLVVAGHGHIVRSLEEGVEGEMLHCILCVYSVWRRLWLLHILCVFCVLCGRLA